MDFVQAAYYKVKDVIWSEYFWFPEHIKWQDLERTDGKFYPHVNDLYVAILIAVSFVVLRKLWEKLIALPIGRRYKLAESPPHPALPNSTLESAFKRNPKSTPKNDELLELSKKLDWEVRRIERWWRRRKAQSKPSEMQRFQETSWRFLFYFLAFYFGLIVLYDKPWFSDTKHCWHNYPKQVVATDIYYYYMIELGFYFSLVISLCMDHKRKDFVEMIVHHVATICLMAMSWSANMVRVGTLVLVVHDAVDYLMEAAKLAKYCKYNKLCDALFIVFAIMWFLTRILLFPLKILRSTIFEAITIINTAPIYFVYNGLLVTLQILHVFWFWIIIRMVYSYVVKGEVEKDGRSDTEPDSTSEYEDENKNKNKTETQNSAVNPVNGNKNKTETETQNTAVNPVNGKRPNGLYSRAD